MDLLLARVNEAVILIVVSSYLVHVVKIYFRTMKGTRMCLLPASLAPVHSSRYQEETFLVNASSRDGWVTKVRWAKMR